MTFEEVQKLVMSHVCARQWDKTKDSRGLAISLSLEANDLLEYFQWNDTHIGTKEDMASELADIIIYAIQFADRFDINISEAVAAKIAKLDEKYPVEIFEIKDKAEQNRRLLEAKKNYKKDTTL